MPEPVNPGEAAELAAADAAAEQIAKGSLRSLTPEIDPAREAELDAAFKEISSAEPGKPADDDPQDGTMSEAERRRQEGEPEPEKPAPKPVEAAPTSAPEKPAPKEETKPEGRRGLLDELLPKPAETPKAEDAFQKAAAEIKLRSDASEKTVDSFNRLKAAASEQIAAVRAESQKASEERDAARAEIEELRKQVGKPTPEFEAELKELREFKALRDVGSRPEFIEKFDKKISDNFESVYNLLRDGGNGVREEVVSALKAMSEGARVEWIEKNVFPVVTAQQKRFIEAKFFDNENLRDARSKELDTARADADKIIAEQRQAPAKAEQARIQTMSGHLRDTLTKLTFFHPKEIPATATAEQKAEIEEGNKLALSLQESMRNAVLDNSPEGRAEQALAVPLVKYYHSLYTKVLARAEAAEGKLAGIEKASATGVRLGRTAAPAPAAQAPAPNVNRDSGDVLDDLFKQQTQSR